MPQSHKRARGFTLVEMAIVLLIVALLSAGAIAALRVQNERSRLIDTREMLNEAREALLSYAAVKGALPCPDTNKDGDSDSCTAQGVSHGDLPWKTLALPNRDPWGQPLQYAVHSKFTNSATLKLSDESNLEILSSDGSGTIQSLADSGAVAMAVWSMGPDATDDSLTGASTKLVVESPSSDDMVLWVSRFVLFGRMLEAGRDIPQ